MSDKGVQIDSGSRERVAYELMKFLIVNHHHRPEGKLEVLNLFVDCFEATGGYRPQK